MRGNTITIVMSDKRGKVAKTIPLYQYDYGQKLIIENVELPSSYEVHFSNTLHGEAITSIGDSTGVDIPDQFLTTGQSVYLWLFLHDGSTDGETEYAGVIPVIKRAEPSDEEPTPEQQSAITQAIAALNAGAGNAEAYAIGERSGVPVAPTDPAYNNNSKYYSDNCATLISDAASSAAVTATTNATEAAVATVITAMDGYAKDSEAYAIGKRGGTDVDSDDPAYNKNSKYYADNCASLITSGTQTAVSTVEAEMDGYAKTSEAYAKGTRGGADVGSDDPAYNKNSKYYSEQAAGSATDANTAKVAAQAAQAAAESAAAASVADWLDAHIDPTTGYAVDNTLTVTGAAADAKKTGDEIGDLKSEINLTAVEHNLITSATRLEHKKLNENGEIVDSTDYNNYEVFELTYDGSFDTFNATIYGNTNYQVKAIAFYDSSNAVISTLEYPSTSGASTFTNQAIPVGTAKIYLCNRGYSGTASGSYFTMESVRLDDIEEEQAKDKKEIDAIEDELDFQDYTINLLSNATYTDGKKLDENGEIQSVSTYEIYEIAYDGSYEKFSATVHSSSNYKLRAISFQDSEGTVLQVLQYSDTSSPYTSTYTDLAIPAGTSKIILANQKDKGGVTATAVVQKSKRFIDIENELAALSVFSTSNKNLFDDSKKVVGLVYEANGTIIDAYTSHRASDYIEVDAGTIYTISAHHKDTDGFSIEGLRYAFYTSDKTFISGAKPEGAYSTFRTPSNAKYIRFSMVQTNTAKWQLERRSFATNYVPYNTIALNDESDEMFMNFPAKTYAVTGLEYNLYLFNVRPDKYENEFKSKYNIPTITKIARFGRFLRLKGDNTNTTTRIIGAEAKNSTKYAYKLFRIEVKNPSNLQPVSVLILGDSTTANGYVPQYLYEFGGENHLITTLGTLGTAPYKHEGRSGWRLYDYFNTSENNPFYNPSTETFDAAYYFTQTGVSQPDIFIINLGINDMHYNSGTLYEAKTHADEFIEMVNAVIASVKGVSSSIKVAVCMTTPPNTDPYSFGSAGTNIIDYDDYRIANLVLCEKLIDAYDYRESEGIYLIPINACLDTKYNMPTTVEHPNSRSDLDITVPSNAANVHPNTAGYHQIADEMYAFICSLYVS